jgi:hypothetical protein
MPIELVNLVAQLGLSALFFYMFWDERKRTQLQDDKHDLEIAALYNLRINDLKWIAKLPTDLEGNYRMGPDSTVKA